MSKSKKTKNKPQSIPGETEDQLGVAAPGEKTEGITRKTVKEQGAALPIGVKQANGEFATDMAFREWTFAEERILGERRKALGKDGDNLARYVSSVLAVMATTLGGHDFTKLDLTQREIIVGQMSLPDVMYAYVWLRVHALSSTLELKLTSPHSRKEFEWSGDLYSVVVKVPENAENASWDYTLKKPLKIRGKMVSEFKLGTQNWNAVEQLDSENSSPADVKISGITSSVKILPEINDQPIALLPHEIDTMGKLDMEKLTRLVDLNCLGPIMLLEVEDPTCNTPPGLPLKTFLTQIDWRYDSFFVASSL